MRRARVELLLLTAVLRSPCDAARTLNDTIRLNGLNGAFSRKLVWVTSLVVAPLPSMKEMSGRSILELGCGDGTALLEAAVMMEQNASKPEEDPVCAVGLGSVSYNREMIGKRHVPAVLGMSATLPHLAVAAGNSTRAALEGVARRASIPMPTATPFIVDGDFGQGLQFPGGSFDMVFSQTSVSKLSPHIVSASSASKLRDFCDEVLRVLRDGGHAVLVLNSGAPGFRLSHYTDAGVSSPSAIFDGGVPIASMLRRNLTASQQKWLRTQGHQTHALPIELVVGGIKLPTELPKAAKTFANDVPECVLKEASQKRASPAGQSTCAAAYLYATDLPYSEDVFRLDVMRVGATAAAEEKPRIVLLLMRFSADAHGRCNAAHATRTSPTLRAMARGHGSNRIGALPGMHKASSWVSEDQLTREAFLQDLKMEVADKFPGMDTMQAAASAIVNSVRQWPRSFSWHNVSVYVGSLDT